MGATSFRPGRRRWATAKHAVLDRRIGGLSGEAARAAGTLANFLVFATIATNAIQVVLALRGVLAWQFLLAGGTLTVAFLAGLVALRRGRQLEVAAGFLAIAILAVVWMTFAVGWWDGFHLYLLTITQIVYIVFTSTQSGWRLAFVLLGGAGFLACQVLAPETTPVLPADLISTDFLFTLNAVMIGFLMFLLAAVAHRRASTAQDRAAQQAARAEYLANTDPLTGLSNRRPITARLEQLAAQGSAYAVAVGDLDRFKLLNDLHGHACGDAVLSTVGERLRSALRAPDALGRWGGEEFIFVLADTDVVGAQAMMERMRELVSDRAIACGDHLHDVTISIGVADSAGDGIGHHVVRRADDALYDAKLAGRNCVRVREYRGASDPEGDEAAPARRGGA